MGIFNNAKSIETELQRFKMAMVAAVPFYGSILLKVPIIRDNSLSTAWTDGRTIRWNSDFFADLNPAQRRYVIMHEVFHFLLMHPARMQGHDPELWNVAADIVVNSYCDQLMNSINITGSAAVSLERPPSGIYVRPFGAVEDIYGRLVSKDGMSVRDKRLVIPKVGGVKETILIPEPDLIPGSSPLSEKEMADLEIEIRNLIRDASSPTRSENGSFFIPRELMIQTQPKPLNWRQLLKDFLSEAQSDDTSYTTPERKYLHMDLILPGHGMDESGELESVWAFVDSSGSVGRDDMNKFLTQLYRIVKEFHCEMNIAYWDTKVTDVYRRIRTEKQVLESIPKHSGGTDINCVYAWMKEHKIRPYVMLILTDGYFGIPKEEVFRQQIKPRQTLLVLCNESVNPVYKRIGRICRV